MSSDDKQNDWSQDPSLSGIDFARLQALQQMASQSRGKDAVSSLPDAGKSGRRTVFRLRGGPDHLCHQSRKIQTGSGKN